MMAVTPALRSAAARSWARLSPASLSGRSGCGAVSACRTRMRVGNSTARLEGCATDINGVTTKAVAVIITASAGPSPEMNVIGASPRRICFAVDTTGLLARSYRHHVRISYGMNQRESWRRTVTFVDKIPKGPKPADLPIEQPTNEVVINVKTPRR